MGHVGAKATHSALDALKSLHPSHIPTKKLVPKNTPLLFDWPDVFTYLRARMHS